MNRLLLVFFITALALPATAFDLSNTQTTTKSDSHVGQNPGTPDAREGGEDMDTAIVITTLPFDDTGNTSDNINDYDVACPYGASLSPDVVYSYTPSLDQVIYVDLCGSLYDTKTYILDAAFNIIACNDDYYYNDDCGNYVSFIEEAYLDSGIEYFIVIDGYTGDSGDYILNIGSVIPPDPCAIICDGVPEGEPALGPGYDDGFNSGCGGFSFGYPFQDLSSDGNGELVFCGKSGWYDYDGSDYRDTDWFITIIGLEGLIEWTLDAEFETYGFLLGPQDCAEVTWIETMTAGPCAPATMSIVGNPGDIVWLWVGPTEYTAPIGFEGYEYNYISTYTGLHSGIVATDRVSFDGIKSLYR